jgi:hypothetical protein
VRVPNPRAPITLFSGGASGLSHTEARNDLLRGWAASYWDFLTGEDLDGTPLIVTQDELDDSRPLKAFPRDKPYLHMLADELMGPQQITLIDKSRQMMVSTLCMLLLYWTVLFKRGRKCFVSKQTQELAEMLLQDKVRGVHTRTPAWFQEAMLLEPTPRGIARATHTGSEIICVGQNAAARAFKGNTASIVMIDEAAVQEFLADMMEAAQPMARRIWVPTTAFHGNPGAAFFRELATAA